MDLLLQEFDLEIKDKKVSKNLVLDHLSRLEPLISQPAEDGIIKETLLDESLLTIVVISRARGMLTLSSIWHARCFQLISTTKGEKVYV